MGREGREGRKGRKRGEGVVGRRELMGEGAREQAIKDRALYRRRFMDIEREQVKENLRRKEHRRKINQ